MKENSKKTPQGRLVEIDGIRYLVVSGKLYRYADLTSDKGFKIVLGRVGSEDVLMHMLNRLIGTSIVHIEYRNTEHPGMTEEERSSRFDVYCEDEAGNCFQVEMQNWAQKFFHKRAVYYSSLVLQDQATKAQKRFKELYGRKKTWDYDFKPLYVVSFLNFKNWNSENIGTKLNPYISTYRYTDVETKNELGDGTNLVFIDLYSFTKELEECESMEEIWLYSIKNMFAMDRCPDKVIGTEIEDLFVRSELAMMSVEQRLKYEEDIMTENDILNSIAEQLEDAKKAATAAGRAEGLVEGRAEGLIEGRAEGLVEGRAEGLVEGRAEGLVEGRAEGEKEKAIEIAQKMLKMGHPIEIVADLTGLLVEDIDRLKK